MTTRPAPRTPGTARQPVPASLFPEIAHAKKRAMLGALAHCLSVKTACAQIGIPRKTHYIWCHTDPQYAAAVGRARALGAEWLEDMAIQRATAGEHPSDTLLIFLLKGALPDKYRDQQRREAGSEVSELLKAVLLELVDRAQGRDVPPAPEADWAPRPPLPGRPARPSLPPPPALDER